MDICGVFRPIFSIGKTHWNLRRWGCPIGLSSLCDLTKHHGCRAIHTYWHFLISFLFLLLLIFLFEAYSLGFWKKLASGCSSLGLLNTQMKNEYFLFLTFVVNCSLHTLTLKMVICLYLILFSSSVLTVVVQKQNV